MKTKIYTYTTWLLILATILHSCKSVNKLYQKGDYEQAVYTAVKKIQKNKLTPETKELITDAYAKAVSQIESEIDYTANSANALKWETMLQKYIQLQNLSNAIQNSAEALQYVTPKNYHNNIQEATNNAVAVRKQRGINYLNENTKNAARSAYAEFEVASRISNNNSEIEQLLKDAYNNAVTNIVVTPIQNRYYNYSYDSRDLENTIFCKLQSDHNFFTKYYTSYNAQANNIRVDHTLSIYYDGIDASREYMNSSEKNLQKDNVLIKEIRIRPDSIVKEYGTVYAKWTEYKITQNFTGKLYFLLQDAQTHQTIGNRSIDADYCFNTEYASYTGDERALTSDQLALTKKRRTQLDKDHMMYTISNELSRKVAQELQYLVR